jgi:hypothetical protein
VENKLKNISVIINKYRLHLLDLVIFANAGKNDDNTSKLFKSIFISIFTKLPREKRSIPVHISIYNSAVKNIKKSKTIYKKQALDKDLFNSINIEDFDPEDYLDIDIFKALESIDKTERVLLCLLIRHKLGIEELATLFFVTPGTILSRISKSRIKLARALINLKKTNNQKQTKSSNDCFYIKNMQARQNFALCSKEENSKINKHLQKCKICKNFYAWHDAISKLIEQASPPKIDRQINADIFNKLNRRSFLPNFWHMVQKSWMIRTSVFAGSVIIFLSFSASYYYNQHLKNSSSNTLIPANSDFLAKNDEGEKLRPQVMISYKIKTTTRRRITIGRELNALLNKLDAKTTDILENTKDNTKKAKIFGKEMNGLTHFRIRIPKEAEDEFIKTIKLIDKDFEIIKHEETTYDVKPIDTFHVEIWVHRKNVR